MQSQEHGITKQHKLGKDCSHSDLIEPESTVGLKIISLCSIRKYQKRKKAVIYTSSQFIITLGGVHWKRSEKYGNQKSVIQLFYYPLISFHLILL